MLYKTLTGFIVFFATILNLFSMEEVMDLMANAQEKLISCNYSDRTIKAYTDWIYRYLIFCDHYNQNQLDDCRISKFLSFLARERKMSFSTQKQAYNALVFFYKKVINKQVRYVIKSRRRRSYPVILSREEVRTILENLKGEDWLIACLIYGSGLNLSECVRLKIEDIDFKKKLIYVDTKPEISKRATILPEIIINRLKEHINQIIINDSYLFPALKHSSKGLDNKFNHISESHVQKLIKEIIKNQNLNTQACCYTLRHSFAVHSIEQGLDIKKLTTILGHKAIRTALIYKQIAKNSEIRFTSPLDLLYARE